MQLFIFAFLSLDNWLLLLFAFLSGLNHFRCVYCKFLKQYCSGLTSSTIATVGNVALFDIWSAKEERKKQGSIVQAAHGMYAFGGVLSGKLPYSFDPDYF